MQPDLDFDLMMAEIAIIEKENEEKHIANRIKFWQINKIERLIKTSNLDESARTLIEDGLHYITEKQAFEYMTYLSYNQLDNSCRVHGGNYSITDIAKDVMRAVDMPNT